jgi:hypothetical protein
MKEQIGGNISYSTLLLNVGFVNYFFKTFTIIVYEIELTQTPMFCALRFGEYNFVHVDREIT